MSDLQEKKPSATSNRPRRRPMLVLVVALLVCIGAGGALVVASPALVTKWFGLSFTKSVDKGGYFFRMKASYTQGDEPIDFDIVVGCAVTVTSYRDGGSSYDAFRDPLFYVKLTQAGNAVMLVVPNACQGETTENGKVPKDFLPPVVWYEKAGDWKFGIAYVSEDAFENANSKLQFHGASIHPATREEWQAFRPEADKNLYPQRDLSKVSVPGVTSEQELDERIQEAMWDVDAMAKFSRVPQCRGVVRYGLSDENSREILREYWPESRPRFWAPKIYGERAKELAQRLWALNDNQGPQVGDHFLKEYFWHNTPQFKGLPTKARGGMIYRRSYPPEFFPLRMQEALPWFNRDLVDSQIIFRDVDLDGGNNKGFLYCFFRHGSSKLLKAHIPDFDTKSFRMRVDGELVALPEGSRTQTPNSIQPQYFFENDTHWYATFEFGLR